MSFGIPVRNGLMLGLTASTALSTRGGYRAPAMFLNFLQPFLDSRITFSRGTNATLIDSTGRLTYAPNNLLTWSEDFTNAAWTKTNCTAATTTLTTDPVGGTSADIITLTGATAQKHILQTTAVSSGPRVFTVYAKAGSHNFIQLMFDGGSAYANFNVSSGVKGDFASGTSDIQSIGNGWYRLTLVSSAAGTGRIYGVDSNTAGWAASSSSTGTFYLWGAQLEQVTYQTTPSTYVATTASAYYGPRFDYDPVTLAPRGLLIEEARTNLLTYSDQFNNAAWAPTGATVSANVTASPDGTTNADKLVETAVTSDHHIDQNISFTTGTTYTFSFYAKAGERNVVAVRSTAAWAADPRIRFTLSGSGTVTVDNGTPTGTITAVGNGWYRCTMTATTNATVGGTFRLSLYNGAYSYAGDGTSGLFLYGAQLEAGSFATSYIPTVASTVTRNADVATMTGTNFSTWYNQSEGTFVIDSAYSPVSGASFGLACAFQGASNFININNNGNRALYVFVGGVNQVDLSPGGYVAYAPAKIASAYKVDDFATTINARTVLTDTSGTLPVPTSFRIGRDAQDLYINNHIRTIAYFNTRLPNAQLQTLTAPSLATTLSLDFTTGNYNVGF